MQEKVLIVLFPKQKVLKTKSKSNNNIGNSFLTEYAKEAKEKGQAPSSDILKNAIKEYQQSLRFNPNDKDARYNLSYAMKLLQNQEKQEQENKDDKENKDNKDQDQKNKDDKENKDNKDQDQKEKKDQDQKEKEDKEKENKQEQENKKREEKEKKQNPKPNETKEQAIKNLDAINNDEQKVLLKVNRKR